MASAPGGGRAYALPMAVVPVQCWLRTFTVEFAGGAASCFVINHRERQWLITAKHVADAAVKNGAAALTLTGENGIDGELLGELAPVPLVERGSDIGVFDLGGKKIVLDNMTLVPSADGVTLSQEAFFPGLPAAEHSAPDGPASDFVNLIQDHVPRHTGPEAVIARLPAVRNRVTAGEYRRSDRLDHRRPQSPRLLVRPAGLRRSGWDRLEVARTWSDQRVLAAPHRRREGAPRRKATWA